jgi:hypothetical protein
MSAADMTKNEPPAQAEPTTAAEIAPAGAANNADATDLPDDPEKLKNDAIPDQDAQRGVQGIQAATLSWDKSSLLAMLGL